MAAAATATAGLQLTPTVTAGRDRMLRPEFTGSASEYFRIWIVNLFFTLITLGIYSAWAKVRKKRYFYGSTRIDGDSFDYFGSPKAILKGRIVAVLLFLSYAFASELYPASKFAFIGVFVLALPWLVVRTLAFNARNSAYRGLRFDFEATPREAVPIYLGMPLLVVMTGGLAYAWFAARNKSFVVSHHALGTTRFDCDLRGMDFFKVYLLAGLMLIAFFVPFGMLMNFMMTKAELPENLEWASLVISAVLMYAVYAMVYSYVQARTLNLLWNGASGPGLRFASTLKARAMMRIYIGNLLAIVATVGLLIPWAVIRTLRYRLENFTITTHGDDTYAANPALERVGATGQEFGDIFNLDLGL
jgi:uncharacterized membrane protein YjgN (DUF898 family)